MVNNELGAEKPGAPELDTGAGPRPGGETSGQLSDALRASETASPEASAQTKRSLSDQDAPRAVSRLEQALRVPKQVAGWAVEKYARTTKRECSDDGAHVVHEVADKTVGRCSYQRSETGLAAAIEVKGTKVALAIDPAGDRTITFGGVPLAAAKTDGLVAVKLLAGGGIPEIDGLAKNARRPGEYGLFHAHLPTTDGSACEVEFGTGPGAAVHVLIGSRFGRVRVEDAKRYTFTPDGQGGMELTGGYMRPEHSNPEEWGPDPDRYVRLRESGGPADPGDKA